jgi:acetolactate synthase I/III small subunit
MNENENLKKNIHTISFLVNNKPGVLVRVAHVFARRGYNIDSLVVSPSVNQKYSRMTITAQGDPYTLDQIIKQAKKLIDVIHVSEHSGDDAIHQELLLIKVRASATTKAIVLKFIKKFKTTVLSEGPGVMIIGQIGTTAEIDELEAMLKKYGIVEMVRTGKVVIAKGIEAT